VGALEHSRLEDRLALFPHERQDLSEPPPTLLQPRVLGHEGADPFDGIHVAGAAPDDVESDGVGLPDVDAGADEHRGDVLPEQRRFL